MQIAQTAPLCRGGSFRARRRPHPWPDIPGGNRHVEGDLTLESAVGIKHLNGPVAAIGDLEIALRVRSDAVRRTELAGFVAAIAPRFHLAAVLVEQRSDRRSMFS
jgi:hypothetical protein